jgi:hypothetical protein
MPGSVPTKGRAGQRAQRLDGVRRGGVACHDDQRRAAFDQVLRDGDAARPDLFGAAVAVGCVSRVCQVAQRRRRQQCVQFTQHGEAADAGVEDADLAAR